MMNRNILNPMMWTTGSGPTPTDYGIYWKPSLGLISLSSDGETRITIADKNLGASQVYNDGDTLSENNCGRYFQWGNNYGFPWTGSVTTSSTQVNAENYGPYYESSTFITSEGWDSSYNRNGNLWGNDTGTYDAMRGPAPEGFHIPGYSGFSDIRNIFISLGIDVSNGNSVKTYLKMPFGGERRWESGELNGVGITGYYWTAQKYGQNNSWAGYFSSYSRTSHSAGSCKSDGHSLRCFKNYPDVPDGTRQVLYQGTGSAGVFWNPDREVISMSSDGENWLTIADKNLGATQVYNNGDTLTSANCGYFYQRGNCYGFPGIDTPVSEITTSSTKVDATNYGPYYYSDIFITNSNWSSVRNDNLRGGVVGTPKAEKGPCDSGYHVPSYQEIENLINCLESIGVPVSDYRKYLKISLAGKRATERNGDVRWQGELTYLWSTTGIDTTYARCLALRERGLGANQFQSYSSGCSIRPFKNTPVVPDSTWTKLF